jgi:thiamine-monophosphate kinase
MEEPGTGTLAELGEFGLIARIIDPESLSDDIVVGPGDDTALVRMSGEVLITTDMLVEGVHFRQDWSSAIDVGRRAVAASLADIAAMGGSTRALVVAFGAPATTPSAWAVACAAGIREEAARAGACVAGGDVVSAPTIVVSVTAIGDAPIGGAVLRSGARAGDVLAICGRFGWAAAGLAVLSRGFKSPRALVDAHRFPEVNYAAGMAAAKGASAMIDVSDGLIADAAHIADASNVTLDIDAASWEIPEALASAAAAYNVDPRVWMLTGGDDHALLATFGPRKKLPEGFFRIGNVVERAEEAVLVNGQPYVGGSGYDHFRS